MNMSNTTYNTPDTANVAPQVEQQKTLRDYVLECSLAVLQHFRETIDGQVYDLIIAQMEQPLLLAVLEICRSNQTKAAIMLGLSRGTLRKKLKFHNIDKHTSPEVPEPTESLARTLFPMRACVLNNVRRYLTNMRGQEVVNMYDMVLAEIEYPLLTAAMEYVNDNQTRAAKLLGLSRGTLRKKVKVHGIEHHI